MSNPHYPSHPGGAPGGGQAPGAYPGEQYPGQHPASGYPQQHAGPLPTHPYADPNPPQVGGPGGGGRGKSVLGPPSGPARYLYIGLLLMLFSFAVKQIVVDLSLRSTGDLLEKLRLQSKQQSEIGEIDAALDEIEEEMAELESNAPKPPEAKDSGDDVSKDMEAFEEKRQKHDEKMGKLKKSRASADKELEDQRKEVRKKYRQEIREASRDESGSTASAIGTLQATLLLKLVMDLFKLAGAAMCILSALTIANDPEQSSGLKVYAAVIGGLAFLSTVVGGLLGLFS